MLTAVRDYAIGNGLTADDVIVTLLARRRYTNVMAKYADTLAGGFFADSNYIAHAVPYTYEATTASQYRYENDVVHRTPVISTRSASGASLAGMMGQDTR